VVVIGAGLSGLAAADSLKTHDPSLQVIVLEASDRVGGRTVSGTIGDKSFDLGGQWILPEHKPLLQIVDKLGLRTALPLKPAEGDANLRKVIQVGRAGHIRTTQSEPDPIVLPKKLGRHTGIRAWLAHLELAYIVWKLDRLYSYITDPTDPYHSSNLPESLAHDLDSITVEAYLQQHIRFKSVQDVIEIQVRLLIGADLNRISLLYLLSYAKWQNASSFHGFLHGEPTNKEFANLPPFCIKDGAQQISQELVKQVIGTENVELNQPVSNVSFLQESTPSQKNVYVTTKCAKTYKCHQVICAIPPNVLRELEFSPPLEPSKRYLLSAMSMGTTIKFVLTYKETYWKENNFSGEFISHGSPITWMTDASYQNKVPTLVGFLGGHQAVAWSKFDEGDLKVAILDQLSIIFGDWALEPTGVLIRNWSNEKFIEGGTICFPGIGTMIDLASIRKSHGPVHFAGTEVSAKFTGTMAGAVHAGHRAAIEVLDRLRPQSLTSQDYFFLKQSHSKLYEDKAKSTANRYSSQFGIWTFLIPSMAFALAWGALKLRSTHGILFVPR